MFTLFMKQFHIAVGAMIILLEIVYLEQLVWLKMLTLISVNILDMVLDLIKEDFFSHPSGGTGRNVNIFGVDISSPKRYFISN